MDRAQLAAEVVAKRLEPYESAISEVRYDLHGVSALFGDQLPRGEPTEVRLRIAARCQDREIADVISFESQYLWMGPAGGGGVMTQTAPAIGVTPAFLPRDDMKLWTEVIDS